MQVVRTLALVAALCSACAVAAQDANSPPPPATNNNNNAPNPTTLAPSSTPAPSTTSPSTTTPRPASGVGPVANVTTDTTGASATVQISSLYDSVEVDIVMAKTNVKSTDSATTDPPISADTKPKMTVLVSTGTSVLQFQTLKSDVVNALEIRSDDDQRETRVWLPANGFADLSKLSSLSFQSVKFYKNTVNMTVPASLAYLKIDRSNVSDIGLYGSWSSDASNLNKVEFSDSGFSSLPFLFYQRSYRNPIEVVNMSLASGVTKLSMEEYTNARHNLGNSTLLSFSPSCENVTSPSVTDFDKAHVVCRDPKLAGIRALGLSNEVLDPTAGPSVAPTPSPTHRGSNSNTTLTVVVVVIAVVAAILAYFVARRYFCTATSSLSRSPRLNERMIAKDETQGNNNKLSFISSDDALRQIRLEQQDVSVTKSVGTGRLWVGDYAGRKVMIKRIEAESSDSYATKALITQARSLAGLSHPNIVSLVGVTWVQGTDFGVVSEFMEKGTLKSVLMDLDADFDLQSKLHMCLDIAQALKYLHSSTHNMYMRRLTSRKVLVNGAIECKLNLFECHPCTTKIEYPEVFGAGELAWQAPELITCTGVLDPRKINMFSLGVLMGEILTRVSPYQSAVDAVGHTLADLDLVKRIRRQERLMPHENRRAFTDLPSALRDMVERCLSYQPLSRPTADDVVQCLESVKNYSERVGSTTSL